ncbi:MAG: pseudouridine synthase [Pseudomonadota bacterium]
MKIKIAKYLADCGIASRRKSEEYILQGLVKVNGKVCKNVAERVDPSEDSIKYRNRMLTSTAPKLYYLINKPRNVISTCADEHGRKTVLELLPKLKSTVRLFPVGRLDYDSNGLMLLTNDGELANKLMHPTYKFDKVYEVKLFKKDTPDKIKEKLEKGVKLDDGFAKAEAVKIAKVTPQYIWLKITLKEGRNHIIKRLCDAFGYKSLRIKRVSMGPLSVKGITSGGYRTLFKKEKEVLGIL